MMPYMASGRWYGAWLTSLLQGSDEAAACRGADAAMRLRDPKMGRRLNTTLIGGARMQGSLRLTVPVEGSTASIKHLRPELWRLSDHGRWRHVHIGALEAAYGSAPYYPYLRGAVEEAILSAEMGEGSFERLALRLHSIAVEAMRIGELLPSIKRLISEKPDFLREIRDEWSMGYTDEKSIFDVIFQKGPETAIAILEDAAFAEIC